MFISYSLVLQHRLCQNVSLNFSFSNDGPTRLVSVNSMLRGKCSEKLLSCRIA